MSRKTVFKEGNLTRQYFANLALCIILGALVIFSVTQVSSALTPKGLFICESRPSHDAEKMMQDLILARYQIGESSKNMVEAEFYIQNNSSQNVKNISVACDFFDENEKFRDRKSWKLAETIPAQNQLKIVSHSKRFVNTQARKLNCSITDFQLVKSSFFTLDRHVEEGHGKAAESGHGEQPPAAH
jgi:hypothetical protein